MMLLLLLAVGGTLTSEVSNEGKQINKEDTEVKTILVKDFDEDSEDDRILHFKMTDDHNCKDGICDDGDFMLTDMPEFAKIHIHSLKDGGVHIEEVGDGTTYDIFITESSTSPWISPQTTTVPTPSATSLETSESHGYITDSTKIDSTTKRNTGDSSSTTVDRLINTTLAATEDVSEKVEDFEESEFDQMSDDVPLIYTISTIALNFDEATSAKMTTEPGKSPANEVSGVGHRIYTINTVSVNLIETTTKPLKIVETTTTLPDITAKTTTTEQDMSAASSASRKDDITQFDGIADSDLQTVPTITVNLDSVQSTSIRTFSENLEVNTPPSVVFSSSLPTCISTSSCLGRCGGGSQSDCLCDESCDDTQNCCCDREDVCSLTNSGWVEKLADVPNGRSALLESVIENTAGDAAPEDSTLWDTAPVSEYPPVSSTDSAYPPVISTDPPVSDYLSDSAYPTFISTDHAVSSTDSAYPPVISTDPLVSSMDSADPPVSSTDLPVSSMDSAYPPVSSTNSDYPPDSDYLKVISTHPPVSSTDSADPPVSNTDLPVSSTDSDYSPGISTDPPVSSTVSAYPPVSSTEEWTCNIIGEFEIDSFFLSTPTIRSNSSINLLTSVIEENLGFLLENNTPYIKKNMVKVNEIEVIDTSVAYTRLKRDVTAFTRIKRQLSQSGITSINKNENARLRIEFLVRLENSLYTTNREKMMSMVTEVILDVPGIVTNSLKLNVLPDCRVVGFLYGDVTVNPEGCCVGYNCVTLDVFGTRHSDGAIPPLKSPPETELCEPTESDCCSTYLHVSLPLMAHSITSNSMVYLVQSPNAKQVISQEMCSSTSCTGGWADVLADLPAGRSASQESVIENTTVDGADNELHSSSIYQSTCRQAFVTLVVLAVNSTHEFTDYVMVGSGCDCIEGEDRSIVTVTNNVREDDSGDTKDEGFHNVLKEVRGSFSKLLSKLYLSLSEELVIYYNSIGASLLERFEELRRSSDSAQHGLFQFVGRSEGSLGMSLTKEDFFRFEGGSINELKIKMQDSELVFETSVRKASKRFVDVLYNLNPIFDKLETFCKLIIYSTKSLVEAEGVSEEFEHKFANFIKMIATQIELAIEASKELEDYYDKQRSSLSISLMKTIMSSVFSGVNDDFFLYENVKFVQKWKASYVTEVAKILSLYKSDGVRENTDDIVDILNEVLDKISGDESVLTKCMRKSNVIHFQQDRSVGIQVEDYLKNSIKETMYSFSSRLQVTIERVFNEITKFVDDAEYLLDNALMNLQDDLLKFRESVDQQLKMSNIGLLNGRFNIDDMKVSSFTEISNEIQDDAKIELMSKIDKEKSNLMKYIASNITDISQAITLNEMLDKVFSNMTDVSLKALTEMVKYETYIALEGVEPLDVVTEEVDYLLEFELKSNGLEGDLTKADKLINSTLAAVLERARYITSQFLSSAAYINLLTKKAITETLTNKNQPESELVEFQSVMKVMKMWQEAQFSQLDTLIRSNLVRRQALLDNFNKEVRELFIKVNEMNPPNNVTAALVKTIRVGLGQRKNFVNRIFVSELVESIDNFFQETKNSFINTASHFTTNLELLKYISFMLGIIKMDSSQVIQQNIKETLGQIIVPENYDDTNATSTPLSDVLELHSLAQSVGSYPTSMDVWPDQDTDVEDATFSDPNIEDEEAIELIEQEEGIARTGGAGGDRGFGSNEVKQINIPDLLKYLALEVESLKQLVRDAHSEDLEITPCNGTAQTEAKELVKERTVEKANTVANSLVMLTTTEAFTNTSCRASGTCDGRCGGVSRSDCWCDEKCDVSGDCCCDREHFCYFSSSGWISKSDNTSSTQSSNSVVSPARCRFTGTCAGSCGGGSSSKCWCDHLCTKVGDCCCDRDQQCYYNLGRWFERSTLVTSGTGTTPVAEVVSSNKAELIVSLSDVYEATTPGSGMTNDTGSPNTETSPPCISAGSCVGRCGGGSVRDCWCDESCDNTQDCCCDRSEVCLLTQDGWVDKTDLAESVTSFKHLVSNVTEVSTTKEMPSEGVQSSSSAASGFSTSYNTSSSLTVSISSQSPSSNPTETTTVLAVNNETVTVPAGEQVNRICSNTGSCAGLCGGGSVNTCLCDERCPGSEECCCDFNEVCGEVADDSTGQDTVDLVNIPTTSTKDTAWLADDDSISELTTTNLESFELFILTTATSTISIEPEKPHVPLPASQVKPPLRRPQRCVTIGGPSKGAGCIFPFIHRSKQFQTCTSGGRSRPWCSTRVDSRNRFISGQWGFCGPTCPKTNGSLLSSIVQQSQLEVLKESKVSTMLNVVTTSLLPDYLTENLATITTSALVDIGSLATSAASPLVDMGSSMPQDTTSETGSEFEPSQFDDTAETSAFEDLEALVKVLQVNDSVSPLETIGEMLNPRLSDYLQDENDRLVQGSSSTNTTEPTTTFPTTITTTLAPSDPSVFEVLSDDLKQHPYTKAVNSTRPRCLTTGGPDRDKRCVFPFTYRNKTFVACTEFWRQQSWWCATKVDKAGLAIVNKWGLCGTGCPHETSDPSASVTVDVEGSNNTTEDQSIASTSVYVVGGSKNTTEVQSNNSSSGGDDGEVQSIISTSVDIEDGSKDITEDQSNNTTVDVGQSNATSVAFKVNEQISSEVASRLIDVQTTDAAYTSVPVDVDDVSKNLATDKSTLASDSCYTVSGVDSGKTCKFPFTYQGKTYSGCTYSFGVDQAWCSTETDSVGKYIPGKWGYCSEACTKHTSLLQECLTVSGPRVSELCVFPFLTGRTLHWGCTEKEGQYWCPTKLDDHAEVLGDNWGWCDEKCGEVLPDLPCNTTTKQQEDISNNDTVVDIFVTTSTGDVAGSDFNNLSTSGPVQAAQVDDMERDIDDSDRDVTELRKFAMSTTEVWYITDEVVHVTTTTTTGSAEMTRDSQKQTDDPVKDTAPSALRQREVLNNTEANNEEVLDTVINNLEVETLPSTNAEVLIMQHELEITTTVVPGEITILEAFEDEMNETNALKINLPTTESYMDNTTSITNEDVSDTSMNSGVSGSTKQDILHETFTQAVATVETVLTTKLIENEFIFQDEFNETVPVKTCSDQGSCEGWCGGGSDSTCWCDELCEVSNDCCCDKVHYCSAAALSSDVQTTAATCLPGSCSGRCGGGSDVDCWCDEMCQYSGDCCCDREAVCSTTTEAPSTSLLLGACGTQGSCNETTTSEPTGEVLDTVVNKLEVETLPSTNAEVLTMQYSELEITTPVVPGKIPTLEAFEDEINQTSALKFDLPTTEPYSDITTSITKENISDMNSGVSGTTTQAVATVETVQTTAATCLPGSCSGRCGGGSDVDCWCDEMCQYSGDCCCDREAVCSTTTQVPSTTLLPGICGTQGSCKDRCGGGSDQDCWCDTTCEESGDCCCDKEEYCALSFRTLENQTSCSTGCFTDSTGPVKDSCCVFPFIYEGKRHNTCVEVEGSKAWCSTAVDDTEHYIYNMWGYCSNNCTFHAPSPHESSDLTTSAVLLLDDATVGDEVVITTSEEKVTTTSDLLLDKVVTRAIEGTTAYEAQSTKDATTFSSVEEVFKTVPLTSTVFAITTSNQSVSSTTTSSTSTTISSTTTTTISSTATTITSSSTTTISTTRAPFKASPEFLSKLPPPHSVVFIPPHHYDPIKDLLGDILI